jgi:uncharacterized membrane protein
METVSDENRLLAALAYPIWIIALFLVLTDAKKNAFMRYHGWQALFFGLGVAVLSFAASIATTILAAIPVIGVLALVIYPVLMLVWVAWFIFAILYAMKAYKGERFEIPFVTKFAAKYQEGASA